MLKKIFVFFLFITFLAGGKFFFEWKQAAVFDWQERLSWPYWLAKSFVLRGELFQALSRLELENQTLRAEIFALKHFDPPEKQYRPAKIYSSYPLNHRGFFIIDAGRNQGLKELLPVTLRGELLIGQVAKVFDNSSQVRTIFSPDWQMPVRVGEKETSALLIGGPELKIGLLVEEKPLREGEVIVAASANFPYGLKIGAVQKIQPSPDGVFKEATVALPYNVNDITEVWVILNYEAPLP